MPSVIALAPFVTANGIQVAFVFLLAQIAIYLPLVKITDPEVNPLTAGVTLHLLRSIVYRTAATLLFCLCAGLWWSPPPKVDVVYVVFAGLSKVAYWLLLLHMVSLPLPRHKNHLGNDHRSIESHGTLRRPHPPSQSLVRQILSPSCQLYVPCVGRPLRLPLLRRQHLSFRSSPKGDTSCSPLASALYSHS